MCSEEVYAAPWAVIPTMALLREQLRCSCLKTRQTLPGVLFLRAQAAMSYRPLITLSKNMAS